MAGNKTPIRKKLSDTVQRRMDGGRKSCNSLQDKFFRMLATPSKEKYTAIIIITLILIVVLSWLGGADWGTITSAFLGIVIAWELNALMKRLMFLNEDRRKVTSDNKTIGAKYPDHERTLSIAGRRQCYYYEELCRYDGVKKITILDDPTKKYSLPGVLEDHFTYLLSAHGSSFIKNYSTVRLDGFEETPDELILRTSRSDFYSHLVTNRAMDFLIHRNVSVRSLFEHDSRLSPLEESKLSNHIGINALVFFSDGAVILKHRGGRSTISKNCLTSSVATRLILDDYRRPIVDLKKMMDLPIRNVMSERLKITGDTPMRIDFLGIARDVYEGGKPQFYFDVVVGMTSREYLDEHGRGIASRKPATGIDEDKGMFVCRRVEITNDHSDKLKIFFHDPANPDRIVTRTLSPERSLYANMDFSKQLEKE